MRTVHEEFETMTDDLDEESRWATSRATTHICPTSPW